MEVEVVGLAWAWALGGNPEPHSRARKPEICYSFWWCNYDFLEADETDRNRSSLPISVVLLSLAVEFSFDCQNMDH